jgi:hypothetical protein
LNIEKEKESFSEMLISIGENLKTIAVIQHAMLINQIEKTVKPILEFLEYVKENK